MDPDATLIQILRHMAEGERDGALDALDALRDWMIGGGPMPEGAAQSLLSGARKETVLRITAEVRQKLDVLDREFS